MAPPFIVIADRGHLKFLAVETAGERQRFRTLSDTLMVEPRLKISERYSDQAGALQNSGDGINASSTPEQLRAGIEENKRLYERIGHGINALLEEHAVERWAFAAPPEHNAAILDQVLPHWRQRLGKNVQRNLVNSDQETVAKNFDVRLTLTGQPVIQWHTAP